MRALALVVAMIPIGCSSATPIAGDARAPATAPPRGLAPAQVPQFVGLGWDDNGDAAGMRWALDVHRQSGGHGTFFVNSIYGADPAVAATWRIALAQGHELGNHTATHLPDHGGRTFTAAQWKDEIERCTAFLTGAGAVMSAADLVGFRSPYLEYGDPMLTTVAALGFRYDCSIEEGYEPDQDGTDYYWPYTLDQRSPGHTAQVAAHDPDNPIAEITAHPGLWELPVYALVVPPDDACARYGAPAHLRARLHERQPWFDPVAGKITGFDYNLWASIDGGGFAMSKAEFVATVTYSFDLHHRGNRAPFLLGAHSAFYVDAWDHEAPGTPRAADRRAAIEAIVAYMKRAPDVRFVSHRELLDWLRDPKAM